MGQSNGQASANMQGIGYGSDDDSQTSTTKAAVTGMAGQSDVTTATKDNLNEVLVNSFDASTVNEELGAQVDITRTFGVEAPKAVAEFSQDRINDIKADPNLSIDEKLAEIAKWDEGGIYRVAAHTVIGALGAGSLEGALTTGGVATAAPKINEYEAKLADALVSSGMSPEAANATSKGVTTLTLAGIGATAGLDTSSTATGINVDSNNRQLHPSEIKVIEKAAQEYARNHKKVTLDKARKLLTYQALIQIDSRWEDRLKNSFSSSEELQDLLNKYTPKNVRLEQGQTYFYANKSSFENQRIFGEYIPKTASYYDYYSKKAGIPNQLTRGSVLALGDSINDHRDWVGVKDKEVYKNAFKAIQETRQKGLNNSEYMATVSATSNLNTWVYDKKMGGFKPGSPEVAQIFSAAGADMAAFTTGNNSSSVRTTSGLPKGNSSKLPTTNTPDKTIVNVTTNSAGQIINRDTGRFEKSPFNRPKDQTQSSTQNNQSSQSQVQTNRTTHEIADNNAVRHFRTQDVRVTRSVKLMNPNNPSEYAVIDQVIKGQPNQTISIPEGYTAVDLRTGQPVSSIKMDSRGFAGIETKTGNANLERNQPTVYNNCINGSGCAVAQGPRAREATIQESAPTNIYILRK